MEWVTPENIRTPTTHLEFQTPLPPSLSEFQRCFQPLQTFLFNLLTFQKSFFQPLKKCGVIYILKILTLKIKWMDQFKQHAVPIVQLSLLWFL